MKGIYQSVPDCIACMNLGVGPRRSLFGDASDWQKSAPKRLIFYSSALVSFADKAVIKKTNGALATVPMSELTIID